LEALIQTLKEHNIRYIISVDDGWDVLKKEKVTQKLEAMAVAPATLLEEYCKNYSINISIEEQQFLDQKGLYYIGDLFNEDNELEDLRNRVVSTINIQLDSSLETLKLILEDLKYKEFEIKCSVDFKDEFKELQGNILYILDKNMGENKEDAFLEYIMELIEYRKAYSDLVIIYSNEVGNLMTHEEKIKYLASKNELINNNELQILYQLWPVSKINQKDCLIKEITQKVIKSLYGKSLYELVELRNKSLKEACDNLLKINIDNIDDMIIDSYIEGGRITDSYSILIDSLVNKSYNNLSRDSNIINANIQLLKYERDRIKAILNEKNITKNGEYQKLREKNTKEKILNTSKISNSTKYGIADYTINEKYADITTGDIFIFNDYKTSHQKAGMIISQECNNVVRKNKFEDPAIRGNKTFLFLLFEIIEISDTSIDNSIIKGIHNSIWPIEIDGKVCLLKSTHKSMSLDLAIVDLCSLNKSGEAVIDWNKEALSFKNVHLLEYLSNIDTIIKTLIESSYNSIISNINESVVNVEVAASSEAVDDKQKYKEEFKNIIVSLFIGIKYDSIKFELRRICRVNAKLSANIIHEYLISIGKIGADIIPSIS
jgi:hypothetical protein